MQVGPNRLCPLIHTRGREREESVLFEKAIIALNHLLMSNGAITIITVRLKLNNSSFSCSCKHSLIYWRGIHFVRHVAINRTLEQISDTSDRKNFFIEQLMTGLDKCQSKCWQLSQCQEIPINADQSQSRNLFELIGNDRHWEAFQINAMMAIGIDQGSLVMINFICFSLCHHTLLYSVTGPGK